MIYNNIAIIVAIADDFAIGKDNDLLFHLPNDLKRFKKITSGHPVIMGKRTLYSLPNGPLPKRLNIVISDIPGETFDGCEAVYSIEEALERVKEEPLAFIIGGGSIYRQFFPMAGLLFLTIAHKKFEADTFFPEVDYSQWIETFREDHFDEDNGFNYTYLDLKRKEH